MNCFFGQTMLDNFFLIQEWWKMYLFLNGSALCDKHSFIVWFKYDKEQYYVQLLYVLWHHIQDTGRKEGRTTKCLCDSQLEYDAQNPQERIRAQNTFRCCSCSLTDGQKNPQRIRLHWNISCSLTQTLISQCVVKTLSFAQNFYTHTQWHQGEPVVAPPPPSLCWARHFLTTGVSSVMSQQWGVSAHTESPLRAFGPPHINVWGNMRTHTPSLHRSVTPYWSCM